MTSFFYALGSVVCLLGIGWCGIVISQPTSMGDYGAMAKLLAMAPGFAVIGSGVLFLAIAGVLRRLDQIVRNTARG